MSKQFPPSNTGPCWIQGAVQTALSSSSVRRQESRGELPAEHTIHQVTFVIFYINTVQKIEKVKYGFILF